MFGGGVTRLPLRLRLRLRLGLRLRLSLRLRLRLRPRRSGQVLLADSDELCPRLWYTEKEPAEDAARHQNG
eukprot:CAMPEP_0196655226 /NCGR_PEP_ID=MMETSP1086-20130531/4978_1 /TAXON_ID=77921 /ORGANISM="Cyanoptyche  gloeocystis , Strain SAG4.97" /LENGTH=70 /DNA_ID=CAMNT_0041987427 /DNA_START=167 /DNA_END=379 /DNA_ORIENTATION=+